MADAGELGVCEVVDSDRVEELETEVAKIIKNPDLDDEVKTGRVVEAAVILSQESFSGPLPHPRIMKGYESIVPGAAERILVMAEQQQQHRMRLESVAIPNQVKQSGRGQLYAFILSAILILFAGCCLFAGAEWLAAIVVGITIISVLTAFLRGKRVMEKDLEEKR